MTTIDAVRAMCRALPGVTEDVKWEQDLCFCVAGKMFAVVNLEPPHSISLKCAAEAFGELVERPGIIPAPYLARNLWVQEQELGATLERRELESLIRTSYDLVVEKLPKSRRPGAARVVKRRAPSAAAVRRSPDVPARARRRAR